MRYEVNAVIHICAVFLFFDISSNARVLVAWPMQISSAVSNAEIARSVLLGDITEGRSARQDSLAEWSKALAQGASPQGRGLEPHSCHLTLGWHQDAHIQGSLRSWAPYL